MLRLFGGSAAGRGAGGAKSLKIRIHASSTTTVAEQQHQVFRAFTSTTPLLSSSDKEAPPKGIPYSKLTVGIPKERFPLEKRVAATPESIGRLVQPGFSVLIEDGAGQDSFFSNADYEAAGAKIASTPEEVWQKSDIVLKLRPPTTEQIKLLDNRTIISFLYPKQNEDLVKQLEDQKATAFAMDCIPRTLSRGQTFDALSSQANISGYRAVLEASNRFGRFFAGQMTAAGKVPPAKGELCKDLEEDHGICLFNPRSSLSVSFSSPHHQKTKKVLVIGTGVAGLAALQTAKNMGAVVRAFDVRPVTKEQVEAMGGSFLEVDYEEDGSGAGGYAKEMSKEWHAAAREMLTKQCEDVDIVITTALIPGRQAPIMVTKGMVAKMKSGSVTVDLAAEAGGNIETTVMDQAIVTENGVTCIGYTDLPSRLPTTSSSLFANNISKVSLEECI